ncbi:MAG: helix-turn-helix domain-containing protein [Thaumarchaeota archaeon]|nr:helix-turn-helix domain-containing protein [Nitrososphaerota archaeon]
MKFVEVIKDSDAAKLISDPMRRAILNLLRQKSMSQSELAEGLGLTDGTVNYHLRLLRAMGFLRVARKELEEHGIMQKFYAPTAYLYIPDVESLPKEVARYYYPVNIERIRGVLSGGGEEAAKLRQLNKDVDELGEEMARELVKVARGYAKREVSQGEGEDLVNEIYTKALAKLNAVK